jgi:hypothetical protein
MCPSGTVSACRTSSAAITVRRSRPVAKSRPRSSAVWSSATGHADPIRILTASASSPPTSSL